MGQAKDTVAFRAAGIRFRYEGSDPAGVGLRKTDGFEDASDEFTELGER
jgi:hypothetical protein